MATADRPFDAVTFDFWDTLVHASPPPFKEARVGAVVDVLASHDVEVDAARVEDLLGAIFSEEFTPAWRRNEQYTAVDAAGALVRRLHDDGDASLDRAASAAVVDAFVSAADGAPTSLTPGIAEVLASLDDADVRIGIICDVGLTPSPVLRSVLDHHGVLARFDHWSFSDEVGCYKPDPDIFAHALAGLGGVAPERAAHVGDLRRTDVAGARDAGLTSVRYRGAADDDSEGPEGHHVVAHHAELVSILLAGS